MFAIQAKKLQDIIRKVATLTEEVNLNLTQDGISILAVDPAHVAMIKMVIGKDEFEEYDVKENKTIGIRVQVVEEQVKLSKGDDVVHFDVDEKENLIIKFGHVTRKTAGINGCNDPKMPTLAIDNKITINKTDMNLGVRSASLITDHIKLVASEDGLELSARGDIDSVRQFIPKENLISYDFHENATSLYNLDYFKSMVNVADSEITIKLKDDLPLVMSCKTGDIETTFMLAPRIESD